MTTNASEIRRYHFVYRVTNIKDKMYYYGTRTTSKDKERLPMEELGITYFSSSSDKEFINDQKENPQNYKYKVLKVFPTREEAIEMEIMLHKKFDVGINEKFYNKAKQTSKGFDTTGVPITDPAELQRRSEFAKLINQDKIFRKKHKEGQNTEISKKK